MAKKIFSDGLARDNIVLFLLLNLFNFLNFLYHFIIARVLTPSDYGILISLISFVYIFNVPTEAIQTIFSRITSKFSVNGEENKLKYLIKKGLEKSFIYSVLIFILLVIISFPLSYFLQIKVWLIVLTNSMIFMFMLSPIPRGVLQGKKKFFQFGSSFVLESTLRLILSVLFVFIGWKVFGAIFGILLGLVFGFFISIYFVKDVLEKNEEKTEFSNPYKFSIPFFIATFVIFILLSLDTILARAFFDPDTAGKYAVLSTLGKMIFFGTASVGRAMFPNTSEKFEKSQKTGKIFRKSFFIISVLSLIAILLFYFIPDWIVLFAFGSQYVGISYLLVYTGIALTMLSLSNIILLYGLSIHRLKRPSILFIFIIVQVILLSIFNSDLKQYLIALIISNTVMFIGSIFLVKKWK